MTLSETAEFMDNPAVSTTDEIKQILEQRRGRSLKVMVGRVPAIGLPAANRDELERELFRLRPEILDAFLEGKVTIIQARFAEAMRIKGERLADFLKVNDLGGNGICRKQKSVELDDEIVISGAVIDRNFDSDTSRKATSDLSPTCVLLRDAVVDGTIDSQEETILRASGCKHTDLESFLNFRRQKAGQTART